MTMRATLSSLAVTVILVGCNQVPTIPGGGSEDMPVPGADNVSPLSKVEAEAVAVEASRAVARAVAAVLPVKDLQGIYDGGQPLPSCPSLAGEIEGGNIRLTLDYDGGCRPLLFKGSTLAGMVEGVSYAAFDSFDLELKSTSFDGESLTGTLAGRFERTGGSTAFSITLNTTQGAGDRIRGRATVDVDPAAGTFTVRDGGTSVTTATGSYSAAFTAVLLDVVSANGPAFLSGSVKVTVVDSRGMATDESTTVLFDH